MIELQKKVEFILTKQEYSDLVTNGSITKNGITHTYDPTIEYKVIGHYLDSEEIARDYVTSATYNAGMATKEDKALVFENITVATTDFVADSTYTDYPYKAILSLTGVTASMSANVYLAPASAALGIVPSFGELGSGTLTIYSTSNESAITIDRVAVTV